jgi:cystathionine beta-synthase
MAVVGALRAARDLPGSAVVVVLLPDHGRGYLSKIFDDEWMTEHGYPLETPEQPMADAAADPTARSNA